jgi:hypothetical protein
MELTLVAWVDIDMDTIEVVVVLGVFWQLFHLRRDATAMLRVIRRMDRKTAASSVDRGTSPGL